MAKSNNYRIGYLDSVRGISALLVLVYHVISSHWNWMQITHMLKLFLTDLERYQCFFVLSGLVLSLKLINQKTDITGDCKVFCV